MIKQEWDCQESGLQHSLTIHKTKPHKYDDNIFQNKQQNNNPYETLYSANPILPPGTHHEKQKKGLRMKYNTNRQILNKTAFPQVHTKKWTKTNNINSNSTNNHPIINQEQVKQQQITHNEFDELLEEKRMIYRRFNNQQFNQIGIDPNAHFSSFFINLRKETINSKTKTLFEFLFKYYKSMSYKTQINNIVNFRSDFECGNLFCVVKNDSENLPTYQLYMQNDINTKGCTQWFYYSVQVQKRIKIKMRLMNFYKPTSLYMKGMKVLVSKDKKQWKRVGTAIKYFKLGLKGGRVSYAMEFIFQLDTPFQPYFFSYGYPYEYTFLDKMLVNVTNHYSKFKMISRSLLCQSFLGNNIYMLNISKNIFNIKNKPIIYIIARQHPGQTPASFIVQGIIKTLLSNRTQMNDLREQFVIKIVPMVNVDGVINGNYRSNISGSDVNRQWLFPSKKLHPEIYYLKQEIISNKRNVKFFLDVHAHSRKMNSFFYGSRVINEQNRFYPFICSKLSKFINYGDSTFCDDSSKKTTARVVLESELTIKKSLTFQVSFYGWDDQSKKSKHHFNVEHFENLGQTLALGLFYSEVGVKKWCVKNGKQIESIKNSTSCKLQDKPKKSILKSETQIDLKIEKNCYKLFQKWKKQLQKIKNQEQVQSQGSSLDPEHFQLKEEEEKLLWESRLKKEGEAEKNYEREDDNKEREVVIFENRTRHFGKIDYKIKKLSKKQPKQEVFQSLNDSKVTTNGRVSFYPGQSNLKNSLMVKQLESELQINRKNKRYQSLENNSQSKPNRALFVPEIHNKKTFKSIDYKEGTNYKQNIQEMKSALKYFIANKSNNETDFDNYKSCLRNARDTSVVFKEKERQQHLRKKYTKI